MKNHKTLKLNVAHQWFEVMVTGQKKREFRKPSDWIKSRLWKKANTIAESVPVYEPREYDFIEIRSGYGLHRPYFIAEYKGFSENIDFFFEGYRSEIGGFGVKVEPRDYIIKLGKIIKIGNYVSRS